ncbi:MAG: zf-TFIIB domain-containing protein [bacterium]
MDCPRCQTELVQEAHRGIEVDHCPACNGRWLDHHELDLLEATVPSTEEERRATIQYGDRDSDLACPMCGKPMTAFNYRAYSVELDTCRDEHGYWLDAGEDGRVRVIIDDRIRGLERSASAEAAWGRFLGGLKGKGGLFRHR